MHLAHLCIRMTHFFLFRSNFSIWIISGEAATVNRKLTVFNQTNGDIWKKFRLRFINGLHLNSVCSVFVHLEGYPKKCWEENTVLSVSERARKGVLLWRAWLFSARHDIVVTRLYTGLSPVSQTTDQSSLRLALFTALVFWKVKQLFCSIIHYSTFKRLKYPTTTS